MHIAESTATGLTSLAMAWSTNDDACDQPKVMFPKCNRGGMILQGCCYCVLHEDVLCTECCTEPRAASQIQIYGISCKLWEPSSSHRLRFPACVFETRGRQTNQAAKSSRARVRRRAAVGGSAVQGAHAVVTYPRSNVLQEEGELQLGYRLCLVCELRVLYGSETRQPILTCVWALNRAV